MGVKYIMGLDVGTTGCKAVVFDTYGNVKGYGFREYPIICEEPFQAEQDAMLVYNRLIEVMREAIAKSGAEYIEAISASVQGDATMPVDREYNPLHNMLLGMDYRTTSQCDFLEEHIGNKQAFIKTGMPIHPINTLAKILWFKDNTPEIFNNTYKFVTYSDFVAARLGGEPVIDLTMASRSMAMDINTNEWSKEILGICGIDPDTLSEIRESGKPCGRLRESLRQELGLKNNPLLITGGHDQPCGAIGAGVIREGMAVDSSGTAEVFSTVFTEPKLNDEMYQSFYPCYLHAAPGLYFTFALNHIGGILLRWFRDTIAYKEVCEAEKQGADFYEYIQRNMKNEPSGILVLPHFNGSGTPVCDVNSKGAITGLTLSTKREDIFKGMLDSLTYELKINIETMKNAGLSIDEIRAVGGGAKSPLWMQAKADILGVPVTTLECKESGCLGAAILAAVGSGIYNNVSEAVKHMVKAGKTYYPGADKGLYAEKFEAYRKLYPALKNLNKSI